MKDLVNIMNQNFSFIIDSLNHLEKIYTLKNKKGYEDHLKQIFRNLHSIKGTSGSLVTLRDKVHIVEDEVIKVNPGLPCLLLNLYEQAKSIAETYMDDPGWSQLSWARMAREEQTRLLSPDAWPVGLADNRPNIERFIGYSLDQELIDRQLKPEELFHESVIQS